MLIGSRSKPGGWPVGWPGGKPHTPRVRSSSRYPRTRASAFYPVLPCPSDAERRLSRFELPTLSPAVMQAYAVARRSPASAERRAATTATVVAIKNRRSPPKVAMHCPVGSSVHGRDDTLGQRPGSQAGLRARSAFRRSQRNPVVGLVHQGRWSAQGDRIPWPVIGSLKRPAVE
jgi:hypothetical protein